MHPGAAREAQEQAAEQKGDGRQADHGDAARQEADHQQQQRIDQERSVDVRILERRADPVIVEENVGMRRQMKKANIAGDRRDERGEQIGTAEHRKPHQAAFAEQAGEHQRGDAEIDRGAEILQLFFLISDGNDGETAADQPQDRDHQERRELAVERQARGDAGDQQHEHHDVVRRRLDERDRAQQHGDEKHEVEKPLGEGCGIAAIIGGGRECGIRVHQ